MTWYELYAHFSLFQVYLQRLGLQLNWKKCKDMSYGMTEHPHLVVLQGKVYMGGGSAYGDENEVVQVYDAGKNVWHELPGYRRRYFAMTVINSRLTVVGGEDTYTKKATNQLAVFHPTSQEWTYPYPPMPTPRYWPAVVMHGIWLLVAGGCDGDRDLATVELFNTSTKQWLSASTLPKPFHITTSTILKDSWYLVTSSKQVFRVSLPDIISQTISKSTATKSTALWHHLPDTPLKNSAVITLNGSLLTVGGTKLKKDIVTSQTDIYLYQPENKKWTKVGDLPSERHSCFCVQLASGELLVAGGENSESFFPHVLTKRVDVAAVQFVSYLVQGHV